MWDFEDVGGISSMQLRQLHGGLIDDDAVSISVTLPGEDEKTEVLVTDATTFADVRGQCLAIIGDEENEPFYAVHVRYANLVEGRRASHSRAQRDHDLVLEVLEQEISTSWNIDAVVTLIDERPPERSSKAVVPRGATASSKAAAAYQSNGQILRRSTELFNGGSSIDGAPPALGSHFVQAVNESRLVEFAPSWAQRGSSNLAVGVSETLVNDAHNEALIYGELATRIELADNNAAGTNAAAKGKHSTWRDSWVVLREAGLWIIDMPATNRSMERSMEFIDHRDVREKGSCEDKVITLFPKGRWNFQMRAENAASAKIWLKSVNDLSAAASAKRKRKMEDHESQYDNFNDAKAVRSLQKEEQKIAEKAWKGAEKDVQLMEQALESFRGVLKASSLRRLFEAYTRKVNTSENYVFYTHVEHFKQLCFNRSVGEDALERRHWSRQAQLQAFQIYADFVELRDDDENFPVVTSTKEREKIKKDLLLKPLPDNLFDDLADQTWTAGIRSHYFEFMQDISYRQQLLNAPHLSLAIDRDFQGSKSSIPRMSSSAIRPRKVGTASASPSPAISRRRMFGNRWASPQKTSETDYWQQKTKSSSAVNEVTYEHSYVRVLGRDKKNEYWRAKPPDSTKTAAATTVQIYPNELKGINLSCDLEVICTGGRHAPDKAREIVAGWKLVKLDDVELERGPKRLAHYVAKKNELLKNTERRLEKIDAVFIESTRSCEYDLTKPLPFEFNEDLEIKKVNIERGAEDDPCVPRLGWMINEFDTVAMSSKQQLKELLNEIQTIPPQELTEKRKDDLRIISSSMESARNKLRKGKISALDFQKIAESIVRAHRPRSDSVRDSSSISVKKASITFYACSHDLDIIAEKDSKSGSLEFAAAGASGGASIAAPSGASQPAFLQQKSSYPSSTPSSYPSSFRLTESLEVEREDSSGFVDAGPQAGWTVLAVDGTSVNSIDELQEQLGIGNAFRKTKEARFTFSTLVSPSNEVVKAKIPNPDPSDPSLYNGRDWLHPKYLDSKWWKKFETLGYVFAEEDANSKYLLVSADQKSNFRRLFSSISSSKAPGGGAPTFSSALKLMDFDVVLHGWVRASDGNGKGLAEDNGRQNSADSESRISSPVKSGIGDGNESKNEKQGTQQTRYLRFQSRRMGTQYYCAIVRRRAADSKTGATQYGDYIVFFDPADSRGANHPVCVVNLKNVTTMRPARDQLHAIELLDAGGGVCRLLPIEVRSDDLARGNAFRMWFAAIGAANSNMNVCDVVIDGLLAKPGIYNTASRRRYFQLVKTNDNGSVDISLRYYIADTGVIKGEILGFTAPEQDIKDSRGFSLIAAGSISYTPTSHTVGFLSPEKTMKDREFSLVAESAAEAKQWITAIGEAVRDSTERGDSKDGTNMKTFHAFQREQYDRKAQRRASAMLFPSANSKSKSK